ncbi:GNAT family N-acetyltransferase [Brevibacillus borstelensis]|uniref:GNAT family N-acetyltransferase n=1 Tax=Brevibacillus borstelensis TaxID=45462 RepID=UPI0030C472E3
MEKVTTDRLELKPMELADAPALFSFWSDPAVSKYMNIETFTDVAQAEQMISLLQGLSQEGKACRWTIALRQPFEIIGSCGFNYLDHENKRAEIGYDLGRPFWGSGYASEAIQALLDYGFQHLRLNRIEAKVEPENIPSIKLLKRLQFTEEGRLRQYEMSKGKLVDVIMFSLLESDWTR